MTDQELIEYYSDLLIMQYQDQPKARATIELMSEISISNQIYRTVKDSFDLFTATGVQLDWIGKYLGAVRTGYLFNGTFISLTDFEYSKLLRVAIALNYSDANLYEISNILYTYFFGTISIYDHNGMRISYILNSLVSSNNMAQLFIQQDLLPKPTGVLLSSIILTSTAVTHYGLIDYVQQSMVNRSSLNSYSSYSMAKPWLSYTYTI